MQRIVATALALSLAAVACGDDDGAPAAAATASTAQTTQTTQTTPIADSTGTAPVDATPVPEAADTAATEPADVTLTTSDGLALEATVYPGGPTWVVLGHMLPADKESWQTLATALRRRGFSVLTYNNRGYGDSEGDREPFSLLVDADAAFTHAIDSGATGIVYGGASMNGAAAISLAAAKDLAAVFTLSAVPSFPSVPDAADSLADITEPALFVAARDDGNAAANAEAFAAGVASGEAMILDTGGHGTRMLEADPTLIETIVDWVNRAVGN